jgi:hypothetical protein
LGTGYATITMAYDAATMTVDYYVNGSLVISDYAGFAYAQSPVVVFGGDNANFQLVSLATSASGVPEPSPWAMMGLGFAGLGWMGYRSSRKSAPLAA